MRIRDWSSDVGLPILSARAGRSGGPALRRHRTAGRACRRYRTCRRKARRVTDDSPILVTGAAGFIGHAVSERLLARGERVIGLDSFTDYYDVALKTAGTARLKRKDIV